MNCIICFNFNKIFLKCKNCQDGNICHECFYIYSKTREDFSSSSLHCPICRCNLGEAYYCVKCQKNVITCRCLEDSVIIRNLNNGFLFLFVCLLLFCQQLSDWHILMILAMIIMNEIRNLKKF